MSRWAYGAYTQPDRTKVKTGAVKPFTTNVPGEVSDATIRKIAATVRLYKAPPDS